MLKEFHKLRQDPGGARRRLFLSEDMELYLWYDPSMSEVTGFQLCYHKGDEEHSFIWKSPGWTTHDLIDDGEDDPFANRTPISAPDGEFDAARLRRRFMDQARGLEDSLVRLVCEKLVD